MSISIILLSLIVGLILILVKRWAKIYDFWKERGVVHRKPYIFVGNMLDNVLKKKSLGEVFRDIALEFKDHKYIGVYNFITADLLITDPDDIQTVLIKQFSHFMDRGPKFEGEGYMEKHLFLLNGAEWKGVRTKVSPAFSSGKLKGMFPLMAKSYEYTAAYLDGLIERNNVVNLKDILDMYIVSVSASTIFGMDPSKLADPKSEFKSVLDEQSKMNFRIFISTTISVFFPKLLKFTKLSPFPKRVENYYIDLVLKTFKERSESGIVRDDIIQQLLQLKQTGKIEVSQWINEDEEELGNEPTSVTETVNITDEILVSQGFIFLLAGFDPLKSALAMLLVELCQNKMIMDRVKEEVATCVNKYNGFTWQAIKEMQYLDWCLSETLRMYPAVETNSRYCVKDFTFPDGITVNAGTRIIIPTLKMHYDPAIYPEPEKFKPERFETPPPPSAFMPFGLGPRMCLARRFALQEMKLFAAKLVADYDLALDPKTELPVRAEKWFFLRRHETDVFLKINKIN